MFLWTCTGAIIFQSPCWTQQSFFASVEHWDMMRVKDLLTGYIKVDSNNYPETLGAMVIINAPYWQVQVPGVSASLRGLRRQSFFAAFLEQCQRIQMPEIDGAKACVKSRYGLCEVGGMTKSWPSRLLRGFPMIPTF
eukprot:1157460-Pelagomonas_calceolata.AAC.4